jgi:hypothetical protein
MTSEEQNRKHHIIELGDLILTNGYGVRYDCMECTDGMNYKTGQPCRNCGLPPQKKK